MSEISIYRGRPVSSSDLTKEQRDSVGYFFYRLKAIDPLEFDRMMPDEKTEAIVKREYASSLIGIKKPQMDNGFAYLHDKRMSNDPDYRFLNIDKIIGLMHEGASNAAQKIFTPSLPEPESAKAERKAKGRERMASLKSMLDE